MRQLPAREEELMVRGCAWALRCQLFVADRAVAQQLKSDLIDVITNMLATWGFGRNLHALQEFACSLYMPERMNKMLLMTIHLHMCCFLGCRAVVNGKAARCHQAPCSA